MPDSTGQVILPYQPSQLLRILAHAANRIGDFADDFLLLLQRLIVADVFAL
jgi:hypothetical protein